MTNRKTDINSSMILCADDYAMTVGVSRGILALAQAKRICATSCMTNRPHWKEWSEYLKPLRSHLLVGLHLNLTLGKPLTPMPKFACNGVFPSLKTLMQRAFTRRLDPHELRQEIRAQLQAFIDIMGTWPDFIDGHQHVHILPYVRSALFDVLSEDGASAKLWLRDPSDKILSILKRDVCIPKALLMKALATGFATQAKTEGFETNIGFSGFSTFDPIRDYGSDFARYLKHRGSRHVIMCHPGEVDEELIALGEVTIPRENELAFLKNFRVSSHA
jgi:chitin disaccharide deacetylase